MQLPVELRDVLFNELNAIDAPLSESERSTLQHELRSGALSSSGQAALVKLLEIALHCDRIVRLHSPAVLTHLKQLYRRLLARSPVVQQLHQLTTALAALRGQRIDQLEFALDGPCAYRVVLHTDACRVQIELSPHGCGIRDMELGI